MANKVLVTGGAGFIGSHLVRHLVRSGAEVTVTVKYPSINDNVRLSSVWDHLTVMECDLRNIDSMRQFKGKSYDAIYHLAAYNHVGGSFLHMNEAMMNNAVATANLLEFAPEFGRFLYMSTSECYGLQTEVPFQEDMLPYPISPYSIGKYAGELYAKMKRHADKSPIVCVRAFNTFGPYQSEAAVIPELIIKCLRGLPVNTTEGKQTREFNFVDNIIEGLVATVKNDPPHEGIMNLGSNREIAICDLVRMIHQACDSSSELNIGALGNRPTEIWRMCASYDKARDTLGWEPKISFEEGLKLTVEWFRKYLEVFYNPNSGLNRL